MYKALTNSSLSRNSHSLLVNFSWLGSSQLLIRLLRLLTIVLVARILLPEDYGIAALVLAANEMFHSLSHGSVSSKLVEAKESELHTLKNTVFWLSWLLCIGLAVLQIALAYPIAMFYEQPELFLPLCVLALGYLVLPLATVQSAMLIREGKLSVIARAEFYQATAETLCVLVLVLLDFGFWALVLPKVLVVPVWVYFILGKYSWRAQQVVSIVHWRSVLCFGFPLAINDVLIALRTHFSALLIGGSLGIEALGVFYFAFNAGLGISMSLLRGWNQALFSHLCTHVRDNDGITLHQFRRGLFLSMLVIAVIVVAQSSLAPWYVPIVFGERWVDAGAIPILVCLCLSALPMGIASMASQTLRAMNSPSTDLKVQLIYTSLFVVATSLSIEQGLLGVAMAILVVNYIYWPLYAWWLWRRLTQQQV